jgi:hypothetical protein
MSKIRMLSRKCPAWLEKYFQTKGDGSGHQQ